MKNRKRAVDDRNAERQDGSGGGRRQAARIEGELTKEGRLPRKEYPRWYCAERKMVGQPFVWHRFLLNTPGVGVPVGGSTVLVVTNGLEGKVLKVPPMNLYAETAQLFQEQRVKWWGYMPAMPLRNFEGSRVLTCEDFYAWGRWE